MKLFRRLFKKEDIVKELWEHLDDMRYGRMRKVNNEFYSGGSYYAYRTVVKHLDNFLHGKRISSKSINEPFIYEFIEYMESLMLSKNTIKNNIKNLYTLLNRLNRIGKIGKCNLPELRLPKDKTIKVYLSAEELVWLKNLKLSSHDRLSTVRDIFLVQCYTSLRFSDASKIMKNPKPFYYEENGHKYFKIITKKTRQPLIIPLKKEVIEILENTNFKGRTICIQQYNKLLKVLCELAGINKEIIHYVEKGGKRQEEVKKKYEMISSHTGRRTFITNAVLDGIPLVQVKAISGHATVESLLNYLHASNIEIAERNFKYNYFS